MIILQLAFAKEFIANLSIDSRRAKCQCDVSVIAN